MSEFIRNKTGIEKGEGTRAFLMFCYIFLGIAALLIVKPVRNSLFLTRFGAEQLPYAFIIVAISSVFVVTLYSKLSGKFRLDRLITYTLGFSIVGLLIAWMFLKSGASPDWFIYAFYVSAAILGIILASQFWLLANFVFNAREAKRIFGFLGAGGIAGGIFGGYLTNVLSPVIGTDNLLLLSGGFSLIILMLVRLIWARFTGPASAKSERRRKQTSKSHGFIEPIKLLMSSRHLAYTACIIGVGVVVANLVDYQYSAIAAEKITDEDELTAFFGFWLSNLSIFSLFIQFFITGNSLRRFGVGNSLYFLPAGILIGAGAVLFAPALWSAVTIKVGEGGFKQSINKAGLELLLIPIPAHIKNKTKTFMDVFVDNIATGLGGILLLLLTTLLSLTYQSVSIVIIISIVIWALLIRIAKKAYIESFRSAIEKRSIDLEDPSLDLRDASVQDVIIKVFEGKNSRQIKYILKLLEGVPVDRFEKHLRELIGHPDPEIKVRVFSLLLNSPNLDFSKEAAELMMHDDVDVKVQAILYLSRKSSDPGQTLEALASTWDWNLSTAAMISAAYIYKRQPGALKDFDFIDMYHLAFESEQVSQLGDEELKILKIRSAEVIGISGIEALYPNLSGLLNDDAPEVLRSALSAAGATGYPEFIPMLIQHLGTKHVRITARKALAQYGTEIIPHLADIIHDSEPTNQQRIGSIKTLSMVNSQKAVNILLNLLEEETTEIGYEIIKALSKLRARFGNLKFDKKFVDKLIKDEIKKYFTLLNTLYQHRTVEFKAKTISLSNMDLLDKAILERLDTSLSRIFRILGFKYSQDDIYNVYRSVISGDPILTANALEFLDNLLEGAEKDYLIPILERKSLEEKILRMPPKTGQQVKDYLSAILYGDDNWLKACALFQIAITNNSKWQDDAAALAKSSNEIVRETAEFTIAELDKSG